MAGAGKKRQATERKEQRDPASSAHKKDSSSKEKSSSGKEKTSSSGEAKTSSPAGHRSSKSVASVATAALVHSASGPSNSPKRPSPPRFDGNRDPDPTTWQEFAGAARTPTSTAIKFDPRNLDLGGGAWSVIRGIFPNIQ
ncbi:MAG: hypothetical protein M1820_002712 [Bogoriella megaspora]|nr:MAG: hypothetical protein M1820_002712 [Bogoriella megaspora]